jgi:hypothetical protein
MPEIVRLSNSKICMYADDHDPPHFHLRGPEWQASVDLAPPDARRAGTWKKLCDG